MKVLLMTLVGLVVFPVFWVLQKLGLVRPPAQVTPAFDALNAHLFGRGISAVPEMIPERIAHVTEAALFRLGFHPDHFRVVTVTLSETDELAAQVESEARGAMQYTGVARNGRLVMACTFQPASADLEQSFQQAFLSFPLAGGSGSQRLE